MANKVHDNRGMSIVDAARLARPYLERERALLFRQRFSQFGSGDGVVLGLLLLQRVGQMLLLQQLVLGQLTLQLHNPSMRVGDQQIQLGL